MIWQLMPYHWRAPSETISNLSGTLYQDLPTRWVPVLRPKMLANQQMRLVRPDGNTHGYMTLHASIVVLSYSRCDTPIPNEIPSQVIHYKANLSQTIGGVNLALCDGGANGCIKGNDIRVLYYNSNGRRVSIGIAGNHQLTGARLCTAVPVVETNQGFVKLI